MLEKTGSRLHEFRGQAKKKKDPYSFVIPAICSYTAQHADQL